MPWTCDTPTKSYFSVCSSIPAMKINQKRRSVDPRLIQTTRHIRCLQISVRNYLLPHRPSFHLSSFLFVFFNSALLASASLFCMLQNPSLLLSVVLSVLPQVIIFVVSFLTFQLLRRPPHSSFCFFGFRSTRSSP